MPRDKRTWKYNTGNIKPDFLYGPFCDQRTKIDVTVKCVSVLRDDFKNSERIWVKFSGSIDCVAGTNLLDFEHFRRRRKVKDG